MNEKSVLRAFEAVFGIDCEEIAIRFYRLFYIPASETEDKKAIMNIDLLRFYEVVFQMSYKVKTRHPQIVKAFQFYDYDEDKHIGSVDILNLIKFLPEKKIDKIFKKYKL